METVGLCFSENFVSTDKSTRRYYTDVQHRQLTLKLIKFWLVNLTERDHLVELELDSKLLDLIKYILKSEIRF
jgi:hypothetical protein